jgi:hypothetical protein
VARPAPGPDRFNYLNPVPLREWYERWVAPMADADSAALLALRRTLENGEHVMPVATEPVRTDWFPHTHGGDRVRAVVLEPQVGGQTYEDWGDGRGHLYG